MSEPDRKLDWTLLRAFVAVMRQGSLSAAARQLRLTQPTLGRQIKALEEAVGEALFDRVPNGLRPTLRALALFDHAAAVDDAAAKLSAALAENPEAASGTVRITASETFGARVVAPILAELAVEHPEIEIEVSATNVQENLMRRDADIAIRLARPEQEGLIAQRVGTIEVGLYATKGYLARHGMPRDFRGMAGHRMVGPDKDPSALRLAERWGATNRRGLFAFRSDSRMAQEAAVHAGIGIGVLRVFEVPLDCELVRVFPDAVVERYPVWLAAHSDMRQSRRLRLVYDALAKGLRKLFG